MILSTSFLLLFLWAARCASFRGFVFAQHNGNIHFCECEDVCKNLSTVNDNRKTVDRLLSKLSVNCQRQQAPLKGCACSCQFQLTTTTTPAPVVGQSCGRWLCRTLAWPRYAVDIFCNGGYIPILRGFVWRGRAGRANADGSRACMRRTPPKKPAMASPCRDGLPSDAQNAPHALASHRTSILPSEIGGFRRAAFSCARRGMAFRACRRKSYRHGRGGVRCWTACRRAWTA